MNKERLKPTNNKSAYHKAAEVIEDLDRLPFSIAAAMAKIGALKQMSQNLDYELKRYRDLNDRGDKVKLGNIEINNFRED